jgi:hypothetical protein
MNHQDAKTPRLRWVKSVSRALPIPALLGALASWRFTVWRGREPRRTRIPNTIALPAPRRANLVGRFGCHAVTAARPTAAGRTAMGGNAYPTAFPAAHPRSSPEEGCCSGFCPGEQNPVVVSAAPRQRRPWRQGGQGAGFEGFSSVVLVCWKVVSVSYSKMPA